MEGRTHGVRDSEMKGILSVIRPEDGQVPGFSSSKILIKGEMPEF